MLSCAKKAVIQIKRNLTIPLATFFLLFEGWLGFGTPAQTTTLHWLSEFATMLLSEIAIMPFYARLLFCYAMRDCYYATLLCSLLPQARARAPSSLEPAQVSPFATSPSKCVLRNHEPVQVSLSPVPFRRQERFSTDPLLLRSQGQSDELFEPWSHIAGQEQYNTIGHNNTPAELLLRARASEPWWALIPWLMAGAILKTWALIPYFSGQEHYHWPRQSRAIVATSQSEVSLDEPWSLLFWAGIPVPWSHISGQEHFRHVLTRIPSSRALSALSLRSDYQTTTNNNKQQNHRQECLEIE